LLFFVVLFSHLLSQPHHAGAQDTSITSNPNFIFDQHEPPVGVRRIVKDQQGFIWFGSANGLYRYDGHSFEAFIASRNDTTGLSGNFLWDIIEATDGRLWIATHGRGINIYDPVSETFGIPEERIPYIFDRFYQANDKIIQQGNGTGIGLALTKELTGLMGGQIVVKSHQNPPKDKPLSPDERFLQRLRDTLDTHLEDEDFKIPQLCEAMEISRMQLHRKLTALTGLPASHFIRRHRLERARELLENTDLNISEIAYRVGFRSHAYFSSSFGEQFGVPPSRYREK